MEFALLAISGRTTSVAELDASGIVQVCLSIQIDKLWNTRKTWSGRIMQARRKEQKNANVIQ